MSKNASGYCQQLLSTCFFPVFVFQMSITTSTMDSTLTSSSKLSFFLLIHASPSLFHIQKEDYLYSSTFQFSRLCVLFKQRCEFSFFHVFLCPFSVTLREGGRAEEEKHFEKLNKCCLTSNETTESPHPQQVPLKWQLLYTNSLPKQNSNTILQFPTTACLDHKGDKLFFNNTLKFMHFLQSFFVRPQRVNAIGGHSECFN